MPLSRGSHAGKVGGRVSIVPGYFVEKFNWPDETSLASLRALKSPVLNTWAVNTGAVVINNAKAEIRFSGGGSGIATYNLASTEGVCRVKVVFPSTGTNRIADVLCRFTDTNNYWVARLNLDAQQWRMGKVVAGTLSFGTNTQTFAANTIQAGVEYTLEIKCIGNDITATLTGVAGASVFTVNDAAFNTATRFGFRAQNTATTGGPVIFDDFTVDLVAASDATASVAGSSVVTSQMRTGLNLVDNDLMFNTAATPKALARTNLNGKIADLGLFLGDFGVGQPLSAWDGTGSMPAPSFTLIDAQLTKNHVPLGSPRVHAYVFRIPWQFTGSRSGGGATTVSVAGDWSEDGRRVLTGDSAQFVEWVRQMTYHMMTVWSARHFHIGSEMKGFQGRARDATGQMWDWEDYAGTAGHADMGFFAYWKLFRQGLSQACSDAGLVLDSNVFAIGPYPVVAHLGVSSSDSVTFDSRNDSTGAAVDYTRVNHNNATYGGFGYVNKAPLYAVDEFLRLNAAQSIPLPYLGIDFGTFNNDNNPTTGIDDFDLAYRRYRGHIQWYKQRLVARGFSTTKIVLDEWYAKAQYDMSVVGTHFIAPELRAQYQASVKACAYFAMLEEGVNIPMNWSPYGRGDQSTDAASQADPMQWYGGMVVRPVDDAGNAAANGGEAMPYLDVIDAIHTYFSEGVPLYALTFSDSANWKGIASATKAMIVNKTGLSKTISVAGGTPLAFSPYEFRCVDIV